MAQRSKKSKKRPRNRPQKKKYSTTENVAYYFLALVGLGLLLVAIFGILGYFEII